MRCTVLQLFTNKTGVISGAMLPLKRTLNLNFQEQETVVSATILAAFASSLAGGNLNLWTKGLSPTGCIDIYYWIPIAGSCMGLHLVSCG